MRRRDITGQTFGRWTVVERAFTNAEGKSFWTCRCTCGTRRTVYQASLVGGVSKSCGCLLRDQPANYKDGRTKMPEYIAWRRMRQRCENPRCSDYPLYGGRGIRVCERWRDFALFLADMGRRPSSQHSIDRRDNSRGYELGNCVWAPPTQQANNKRNNRVLTFGGQSLTLQQWAQRTGIPSPTIRQRLDRDGWTLQQALTTPAVVGQKHVHVQ